MTTPLLTSTASTLPALVNLHRRRRWLASGECLARLAAGIYGVTALVFVLDLIWRPTVTPRIALLLAAVVLVLVVAFRAVRRRLRAVESIDQLALLVQQRYGIDSDLIAAWQFPRTSPHGVESPELREAVAAWGAARLRQLDLSPFVSYRMLRRPVLGLVLGLLAGAAASGIAPQHVATFVRRMRLQEVSYPTDTRVLMLSVAGRSFPPAADDHAGLTWQLPPVRCPLGQATTVQVLVHRLADRPVFIDLEHGQGPHSRQLSRTTTDLGGNEWFTVDLPRIDRPVRFTLRVGDVPPIKGELVPVAPPLAAWRLAILPPAYVPPPLAARASEQADPVAGSRLTIACEEVDRPLARVEVVVKHGDSQRTWLLQRQPNDSTHWRWPESEPLTLRAGRVELTARAVDADGFASATPLQRELHLVPDLPPRLAVQALPSLALPGAMVPVAVSAADSWGVARGALTVTRERADAAGMLDRSPLDEIELPIDAATGSIEHVEELQLAAFSLRPGDIVVLTATASDHQPTSMQSTTVSEPRRVRIVAADELMREILSRDEAAEALLNEAIELHLRERLRRPER